MKIKNLLTASLITAISLLSSQESNAQFSKGAWMNREDAIEFIEQRLERGELEISTRSQTTDRLIQRVYLAIHNLIYLCLTGFSTIGAILLLSSHPLWSLSLWGIASLGMLIWLRSSIAHPAQHGGDRRGPRAGPTRATHHHRARHRTRAAAQSHPY